jgi:hypothetical protein
VLVFSPKAQVYHHQSPCNVEWLYPGNMWSKQYFNIKGILGLAYPTHVEDFVNIG